MNPKSLADKRLTCVDCNSTFFFTVGEQKFLYQLVVEGKMESVAEPKRCADCRKKKKQRYAEKENRENKLR